MKRVFSGVQPTGNLHIGNYIGAVKNWVSLQNTFDECIYCVVDQHAITVPQDPKTLRNAILEATAILLAAGVDPKKHTLFVQSAVPGHAQLAWVLNCVARMGWLKRMTQFKDKAKKNEENVSVGLFDYPVLMAADIILYNATHVPVGDDQKQHVELARDTAIKFNHDFKVDFFNIPEPYIPQTGARIMSLKDATKKMSKSEPNDASRINLMDDADTILSKIKKAKTDPLPLPETVDAAKERPEAYNLLSIYAAAQNRELVDIIKEWAGRNFSEFKPKLAEVLTETLTPISSKVTSLLKDKAELEKILKIGAEKANAISTEQIRKIYDIVGFI